jgi:hypothetical protein
VTTLRCDRRNESTFLSDTATTTTTTRKTSEPEKYTKGLNKNDTVCFNNLGKLNLLMVVLF